MSGRMRDCPADGRWNGLLAGEPLTEERWDAIVRNDSGRDGEFFYAVRTTRIFCRPSCKSKSPLKENTLIFRSADQALQNGFRPCKRCKPTGVRLPHEEWVEEIKDYLNAHLEEPLRLDALADACHGSPYHLHRTFKRVTGKTPADYLFQVRMGKAADELLDTDLSVAEIGRRVGMANPSHFASAFRKRYGLSPAEFRREPGISGRSGAGGERRGERS